MTDTATGVLAGIDGHLDTHTIALLDPWADSSPRAHSMPRRPATPKPAPG